MRISNPFAIFTFLFISTIIFSNCQNPNPSILSDSPNNSSISEFAQHNGIFIETVSADLQKQTKRNPYNNDNNVYQDLRVFKFDYKLYGETSHSKSVDYLVSKNSIKYKGGGGPNCFADDQDNKRGSFFTAKPTDSEGTYSIDCFVENKKNVFFPFKFQEYLFPSARQKDETVIKSNNAFPFAPHPFIQLNMMEGNTWTHKKTHVEKDTKTLPVYKRKDPIAYQIVENYEHHGTQKIHTPFGKLECEKVFATSSISPNRSGSSRPYSLTSYFHPTFGFVKLEYDLQFGSLLVIELTEIDDSRLAQK